MTSQPRVTARECAQCCSVKPLDDFTERGGARRGERRAQCKDCERIKRKRYNQLYNSQNRELVRARKNEYKKRYRIENPEIARREARSSHLKQRFGLSQSDYEKMLTQQGGKCAVCATDSPGRAGTKHFLVDHCHLTGRVRALLCNACNSGLGHFADSPERLRAAAIYLEGHRS
jgi:hypothetical protein